MCGGSDFTNVGSYAACEGRGDDHRKHGGEKLYPGQWAKPAVILVITTTRRRRLHTFLHAFTHKAWTEPNNLWLAFDKHVLRRPETYIRHALDRRYSIFPFPESPRRCPVFSRVSLPHGSFHPAQSFPCFFLFSVRRYTIFGRIERESQNRARRWSRSNYPVPGFASTTRSMVTPSPRLVELQILDRKSVV